VALPGLQVQGGNGNGAIGQVSSTGSQYVFVSTVAPGASDISILGGGGIDAFGQVSAASMLIGTTGGITLTPGTGANADSTLTAGQIIPYGCGVGFTCAFPVLPGNFRTNGIADFGGAPQTVQVDLATFTGQFPFSSQESPFVSPIESTTLLLWNTAGWWLEPGEEDREVRLGRLLPVCR
jgi:hypothetical protein